MSRCRTALALAVPLLLSGACQAEPPRSPCDPPAASAPSTSGRRWRVTITSGGGVSTGVGIPVPTSRVITITPTVSCMEDGSAPVSVYATEAATRDAVAGAVDRLLREHPDPVALGPFSLGPEGPPEGWFSQAATVEVEGRMWEIRFAFGRDLAALPEWLAPAMGRR
jgi:hypothetical protein